MRAIDNMKVGDKDKTDVGEYSGLRLSCGKTGVKSFKYKYRSPIDHSLICVSFIPYWKADCTENNYRSQVVIKRKN